MKNREDFQYKIFRLNEQTLKSQKSRLLALMKELTSNQSEFYYQKKIDDMRKFVKDGSAIIFVATVQESIVGFIWGYIRENEQTSRIHVTQFVVGCDYRSMGIGGDLLHQMKLSAREHELTEIELNVSRENKAGIQFYLKNGFVCKTLFMVADGLDLVDKEQPAVPQ